MKVCMKVYPTPAETAAYRDGYNDAQAVAAPIIEAAIAWRHEWINYAHDNVPTTQRLLDAIEKADL